MVLHGSWAKPRFLRPPTAPTVRGLIPADLPSFAPGPCGAMALPGLTACSGLRPSHSSPPALEHPHPSQPSARVLVTELTYAHLAYLCLDALLSERLPVPPGPLWVSVLSPDSYHSTHTGCPPLLHQSVSSWRAGTGLNSPHPQPRAGPGTQGALSIYYEKGMNASSCCYFPWSQQSDLGSEPGPAVLPEGFPIREVQEEWGEGSGLTHEGPGVGQPRPRSLLGP